MKKAKLFSGDLKSFKADADNQWRRAFNLDKMRISSFKSTGLIETDGIALCVHFRRDKTPAERKADEDKEAAKLARKQEYIDNKNTRIKERDEKEARRVADAAAKQAKKAEAEEAKKTKQREADELKALKTTDPAAFKVKNKLRLEEARKCKEETAKAKENAKEEKRLEEVKASAPCSCGGHGECCTIPQPRPGDISVDPGCTNIFYVAIVMPDGSYAYTRMTKGHYKTEGGMRRNARKTERWIGDLRTRESSVAMLDNFSQKTASVGSFENYIEFLSKAYQALWKEKTAARWARERFNMSINKPRAIDAFLAKVVDAAEGKVSRVFYGGGKWSPSAKGREATPVGSALKRWKLRFGDKVEIVDEYLTSQCCFECGARTRPVAHQGEIKATVRGLVCCDSSKCSVRTQLGVRGTLMNRDRQGALNILVCGAAGSKRPKHMTRQGIIVSKRSDKVWIGKADLPSNVCRGGSGCKEVHPPSVKRVSRRQGATFRCLRIS